MEKKEFSKNSASSGDLWRRTGVHNKDFGFGGVGGGEGDDKARKALPAQMILRKAASTYDVHKETGHEKAPNFVHFHNQIRAKGNGVKNITKRLWTSYMEDTQRKEACKQAGRDT